MSFEVIQKLEEKVKEVSEQLQKHSTYVTEIANTVEKLLADKATTTANANILNGALQAYNDILNLLKASESKPVDIEGSN